MRLIFSVLICTFLLSACASKPGEWEKEPYHTRIYEGNFDQVWLAALKALGDYPLKISNKDVGKIHTETVNGPYNDLVFTHPEQLNLPERFRYDMKLRFAKFATDSEQPMVRVRIVKDLEKYKDFYTGWRPYPSDGLEEKIVLYRILQILNIEKKVGEAS